MRPLTVRTSHTPHRWTRADRLHWGLLSLVCGLSLACNDAGVQRVDPDALVQSPLQRLWHVGGVDDTTLVFEILTRNDLAVDTLDRVYVIDRTASRIAVLDSSGRIVGTRGAPGPGPGEFLFPLTLAVAPNGALHVLDAQKGRILVFADDGQFTEEYVPPRGHPFRFRMRPDASVVGTTAPQRGGAMQLLLGTAESWQTLDSIPSGPTGIIESVCDVIGHSVEPVFQPRLAWDARGDTIVSAVGDFSITVRTSASAPRVIARDTSRRSTDRALAARELGEGRSIQVRGRKPCTIPTDMLLAVAHIEPRMPAYSDLTLGPHGSLWATRDVLGDEPTVADVFHLDSGFVATVLLSTARPVAFLRSGVLISIEADEDGVPRIVAYRVPSALRTKG